MHAANVIACESEPEPEAEPRARAIERFGSDDDYDAVDVDTIIGRRDDIST